MTDSLIKMIANLDGSYGIIRPHNSLRMSIPDEGISTLYKYMIPNAGNFQTASEVYSLLSRAQLQKQNFENERKKGLTEFLKSPHEPVMDFDASSAQVATCICGMYFENEIHSPQLYKDNNV